MSRNPNARYAFRAVEEDDLPLLGEWLRQPHVAAWWGDPGRGLDEIRQGLDDVSVEPMIVELNGRPIAYAQSYDPHLEDDHPYADQPFGTLGIDLSIGDPELTCRGHGTAIVKQLCDLLFAEGAPRVVIDPDPDNARAIRAYEKAGFKRLGLRDSIHGPALLMALDSPDASEGEDDI